jgi:hypothetical protein
MIRFVERSVFVFLLVAALLQPRWQAMVQHEPQQFVIVYVEFKPANTKTGSEVLEQLAARADDSSGVIRFDVLADPIARTSSLCSRSGAVRRRSRTSRARRRPRPS